MTALREHAPEAPVALARPAARPRLLARALAAAAPLVTLGIYLALASRAGLPASDLVRQLLVVALTQVGPGVVGWRWLRGRTAGSWVEDLALGFAVGAGTSVLAGAVAGRTHQPLVALLLGPALAAAVLAVPAARRRVRAAPTTPLPWWWGPSVAVVALAQLPATTSFFTDNPLRWHGWHQFYTDIPYHLALAGELAQRGPEQMPNVLGQPLYYHWFSYAWIAQVATASHTSLDSVLLRFMPALLAVVVAVAIAAAAVRLTGWAAAGPLAAVLGFAVQRLDLWGIPSSDAPVYPDSPTTGLSQLPLLALVVLLGLRWRHPDRVPRETLAGVAGLSLVAVGTKGSTLPILVPGLALALVVALLTRAGAWRRVLLDLVTVTVVLEAALRLLFHGSDTTFAPAVSLRQLDFAALVPARHPASGAQLLGLGVVLVFATAAQGLGLLGLLADRVRRRDPVTWLLVGAGVAGVGGMIVFAQFGRSQLFFLRSGLPLLAIASAAGLIAVLSRLRPRVAAAVVFTGLAAAVVVPLLARVPPRQARGHLSTGLATLGWFLLGMVAVAVVAALVTRLLGRSRPLVAGLGVGLVGLSLSGLGPTLTNAQPPSRPVRAATVLSNGAFHSDQAVAARWLRDHSGPYDVVATNRHCLAPVQSPRLGCDARRFFVSAYTQRRVLVEGWGYTWRSNMLAAGRTGVRPYRLPFWDRHLLAVNDQFIRRPTFAGARFLAARGVRWIFVDDTAPHAATLAPFAAPRFRTAWAQVYQLPRGG